MNNNTLTDDPRLGELLRKLQQDDAKQQCIVQWKQDFLDQFDTYLPQAGTRLATQAYQQLQQELYRLLHLLRKVEHHLRHGNLSSSSSSTTRSCTVAGRHTLTELARQITVVSTTLDTIIPGTVEMEDAAGYTKYHLGCVLVRDGFRDYASLVICDEILHHLQHGPAADNKNGHLGCLQNVADRTLWEEVGIYHAKLQKMVDIMSDLGLYKVICKANEDKHRNHDDAHYYTTEKEIQDEEEAQVEVEQDKEEKEEDVTNDEDEEVIMKSNSRSLVSPPHQAAVPSSARKETSEPSMKTLKPKNKNNKQTKSVNRQVKVYSSSSSTVTSSSSSSWDFDDDLATAATKRQNNPNYDPYKEVERLKWKFQDYDVSDPTECFLARHQPRDPNRKNKYLDDDDSSSCNVSDNDHDNDNLASIVVETQAAVVTPLTTSRVLVSTTTRRNGSRSGKDNVAGTVSKNSTREKDHHDSSKSIESSGNNGNKSSSNSGGVKRSLRPGMLRGGSFDDGNDYNVDKSDAVQSSFVTDGKEGAKAARATGSADRSLRSCIVRGESFDNDKIDCGQSPPPISSQQGPKSSRGGGVDRKLRPGMPRGGSFKADNDIDSAAVKRTTKVTKESRIGGAGRSLRPGMVRGQSFDGIDKDQTSTATLNKNYGAANERDNLLRPTTMRGSSFDGDDNDDDDDISLPACARRGGRCPRNLQQLEAVYDKNVPLGSSISDNDSNSNQDAKSRGGADRSPRPGMLRGASFKDDNNSKNATSSPCPTSPAKSSSIQNVIDAISGIVPPDKGYVPYEPSYKKSVPTTPSWAERQQNDPAMNQQTNSRPMGISLPDTHSTTNMSILLDGKATTMEKEMVSRDLDMRKPKYKTFEKESDKDNLTPSTMKKGTSRVDDMDKRKQPSESTISSNIKPGLLSASSSSSSSSISSLGISKKERATKEKCYMWYARLGQPNREFFKRKVAALPDSCDIRVEDVDDLPWLNNGAVLSVREMNKLFMSK